MSTFGSFQPADIDFSAKPAPQPSVDVIRLTPERPFGGGFKPPPRATVIVNEIAYMPAPANVPQRWRVLYILLLLFFGLLGAHNFYIARAKRAAFQLAAFVGLAIGVPMFVSAIGLMSSHAASTHGVGALDELRVPAIIGIGVIATVALILMMTVVVDLFRGRDGYGRPMI
ncbi:MAG TPA: NINE protein [Verrucomicrobiae bacterium]|nr:NINE protein [Verrucomicrobiae bacterium]